MKNNFTLLLYTSLLCIGIDTSAKSSSPESNIVEQPVAWVKTVDVNLFTPDDNSDNKFVIYINDGILNIKYNKPFELANGEVIVFNLLGQEVIRKKLEITTINQVSLSIQNTCYIVKISYSGKVHTQKVVPSK